MTWETFYIFAIASALCTFVGAFWALKQKSLSKAAIVWGILGVVVHAAFLVGLWLSLERPPLRTMGETRLWYSLFVMAVGLFVYALWKFRWILLLTGTLATVFNVINLLKPEIHDQSLMPALQSPWFIPHVTIYMLAYSILACATLLAFAGWFSKKDYLSSIDNLVYIGTGMIFLGLLSGSTWAKLAWGDFWSWDPKETWAAVTCCGYLGYIHLRFTRYARSRWTYALVIVSFALLQMCWYGYQYLPSSADSMHLYNVTK